MKLFLENCKREKNDGKKKIWQHKKRKKMQKRKKDYKEGET